MKGSSFSLNERITLFSIFFIGIFLTLIKYSQIVNTNLFLTESINYHTFKTVIYENGYLELIPPILLTIGSIYLLLKANKLAWRMTYIPLTTITIYFSYNVLLTILSGSSTDGITIIEFFSMGFLICINFILLLFCFFLFSKNFKEKLKL